MYAPRNSVGESTIVQVEWAASRSALRFRYADEITFYLRADLREVWSTWPPPYTVDDAMVYLLGPILAYALRARGVLTLHASAAVIDGRVAAFCGSSGTGKSTIAAGLAAAGHGVLSDDVLALRAVGGVPMAYPAYGYLRVWEDSARALIGDRHGLPLLTPNWGKHAFPVEALGYSIVREPAPLGWIFLIEERSTSTSAPKVTQLRAVDAFVPIVANTAANYLLSPEQRVEEFGAVAALLGQIPVFRLTPHAEPQRMADLITAIERCVRA